MVDPKKDLRDYLRNNLNTGALTVPMSTSDIVIGDPDGSRTYPQAAVTTKDPIVPGGGETQATGINPAKGSAPIQDVVYTVQVDCWGGPHDADVYANHGSNPDRVANDLGEEVAATCRVGQSGSPANYEWLFAGPPQEADDTDHNPTSHREVVTARLKVTFV
jgi:hypothetical protein